MTAPDEGTTKTPPKPETREITFHERAINVFEPTKEQFAVLLRLSQLRPAKDTSTARQIATINRLPLLVSSLFADDEDWDWVEDGLATNEVKWEEIIDIAIAALKIWYATPQNREQRRAASRTKTIEGTARRTR